MSDNSTDQQTTRTDSEDKLWRALRRQPDTTSAELAAAAGIGRSTAGKILARWDADGTVTRTPGNTEGGRRTADRWTITEETTDTTTPDGVIGAAEAVTDGSSPVDAPTAAPDEPASDSATTHPDIADAAPTAPATNTAVGEEAMKEPKERLAPGVLHGRVEDFLREHPGVDFSPGQIGKALGGKSPGAVSNICEKLVTKGYVSLTSERPKRYAIVAGQSDRDHTTTA